MGVVILVIIMAGLLLGKKNAVAAIKITGGLLIPTAGGKQSYRGILTITRAKIRVECDRKIFKPFNEFDAPKQSWLNLDTSQVVRIEFDEKEKKIYLRVENSFVDKYRNLFNLEFRHVGFDIASYGHLYCEFWAIIFSYEKSLDIGCLDKEVLNSINSRVYPVYTKHYFYSTNREYLHHKTF
jgi:hypothetical protein